MTDDEDIDEILERVPDRAGAPMPDVAALVRLRSGLLDDGAIAEAEAAIAAHPAARGLYAELEPEVDERQLRFAVQAGLPDEAPMHSAPVRWPWALGGGLAAAAAILVLVSTQPSVPELPPYHLTGSEGVALQRSDHGARAGLFRPQTVLKLVYTPDTPVAPPPTLRLFVARPGGPLMATKVSATRGAGGAFRAAAPARAWFGDAPGTWEVHAALVPAGLAPVTMAGRTLREARKASPGVSWMSATVRYVVEAL